MKLQISIWRNWTVLFVVVALGCRPQSNYVGGVRDPDAVQIRLHNRSGVNLLVSSSVRTGYASVAVNDLYHLPAIGANLNYNPGSDLEVAMFRSVPASLTRIGAFSIDVNTTETESRLGVVDIARKEMTMAKSSGRITIIFRPKGIGVIIGQHGRFVPYIRPLPVKGTKSS
ncbi:MAG: hypothetical protein JNM34_09390 [Chthonomonadaceae bacterium]|nr:hypothetical protein [Chthonomonadaceae bacterium]